MLVRLSFRRARRPRGRGRARVSLRGQGGGRPGRHDRSRDAVRSGRARRAGQGGRIPRPQHAQHRLRELPRRVRGGRSRARRLRRRPRRLSVLAARDRQRRDGGSRLPARGRRSRDRHRPRQARRRLALAGGGARPHARGLRLPRRELARLRRQLSRVPWEVDAVLALIVLDGIAVIATYSRFPPSELYHVHHSDTVAGGFGRELVALNFPFALVGIALVGLAWPRLQRLRAAGVVAIALCAVVYFAVDQSNLDAKPLNVVPALGLALAVALAFVVGVPSRPKSKRGDRVRIGIAAVLVFFCAPLIAAELGFFLDGVPFLGWFYETARLTTQPGVREFHHAVH